jgi:hypothetical protein
MVELVTVPCQECGVELAADSPELRLELATTSRSSTARSASSGSSAGPNFLARLRGDRLDTAPCDASTAVSSRSPVVLDGVLSDEKVAELLGFGTEYPDLDFKDAIDVERASPGLVELAKDVGAMQVHGGYIIGGVDNRGTATGSLDGYDKRKLDQANLVQKLLIYLPEPLTLHTRVLERDGHTVVAMFVDRHPAGCAIFRAIGQYKDARGENVIVFRRGDVFWRNGTRSERITQPGFEAIIERRIEDARQSWFQEHQEVRRAELEAIERAYESRAAAQRPLAAISLALATPELSITALELLRTDDTIALQVLLNDGVGRARSAIQHDEIDTELADVVDKLACLAATFLTYERSEWFDRAVGVLGQIYNLPLENDDPLRFNYATSISSTEIAPRVWLHVIERVYGLGALAVRRRDWPEVRTLAVHRPSRLDEYDRSWLRHALTMASRARHLEQTDASGQQTTTLSLLSLARDVVAHLDCLRADGLAPDDDLIVTALAQFDALANVAAIDNAGKTGSGVFYPNFARFRQERIMPVVEQLLTDDEMRSAIFRRGDEDLALALDAIGEVAHREGIRYNGFGGFSRTTVGEFIDQNRP